MAVDVRVGEAVGMSVLVNSGRGVFAGEEVVIKEVGTTVFARSVGVDCGLAPREQAVNNMSKTANIINVFTYRANWILTEHSSHTSQILNPTT